ncbi:MAG: DUF2971 domain-containing protein [Armatimonadetes bacterium]|nr:DUF2971 domain-containing protein [Armatimonadota bacterium]
MESTFRCESHQVPPVVYKYAGPKAIEHTLKSQEIRFTSSSNQNDINENLWEFTKDQDFQVKQLKAHTLQTWLNERWINISKAEYDDLAGAGRYAEATACLSVYLAVQRTMSRIGILSLSSDPQNILLWGHYACHSTGICVGFDSSAKFLRDSNLRGHSGLHPVVYSDNRSKFDYEEPERSILGVVYTKSSHWKYESEVRAIRELPSGESHMQVPFEASDIKEIIVGAAISAMHLKEILAVRQDLYPYAKLLMALPDPERFATILSPVPPLPIIEGLHSGSLRPGWEPSTLTEDSDYLMRLTKRQLELGKESD